MSRRMHVHRKTYFLTSRVAAGLPFVPNEYITRILLGVIARGAKKYSNELKVCGFVFMPNHYHLMVVTSGDPAFLKNFMNWINGEVGKIVAQLLGTRRRNIWEEPYNDVVLLEPDTVIRKLVYLLANPVMANLVGRASEWFGCGSYAGSLEPRTLYARYVRPSQVQRLPRKRFSQKRLRALVRELDGLDAPTIDLKIDPLAWMECFSEQKLDVVKVMRSIYSELARVESEAKTQRERKGTSLPTRESLELRNPHAHYVPTSRGRRVFCMAESADVRCAFIELYERFCQACRKAYQAWRDGIRPACFPPGAIEPNHNPRSSIVFLPM